MDGALASVREALHQVRNAQTDPLRTQRLAEWRVLRTRDLDEKGWRAEPVVLAVEERPTGVAHAHYTHPEQDCPLSEGYVLCGADDTGTSFVWTDYVGEDLRTWTPPAGVWACPECMALLA